MSNLEISPELVDALHKLSSLLESDDALIKTLDTVVELSVAALPGCDSAGITIRSEGRDTTAAASDEYALEIDKIQYSSNEGPCVAAIDDGEIKRIEAVSEEKRWPEFCRRAEKHGFRSGLSLPLKMNGTVGALNLYALTEGAYDERSQAIAEIFARQVTIALQNAETYLATRDLADGLNTALQSRDMIGQAKGILMERENISDEEAFEMLKRISQNSNIKLRDVAQKVIDEKARS